MLSYEFKEIQLGSRYYLPLPKLNSTQVREIGKSLSERGFKVEEGRSMKIRGQGLVIHIDPTGLCWSAADPADVIGPVIPKLLTMQKDRIPLRDLSDKYFRRLRVGTSTAIRLTTRLETTPTWRSLRTSGRCGLTPDERAIANFFFRLSVGCLVLTDFPTPSSRVRMVGKKQYYESFLDPQEAGNTIRSTGDKMSRNSYLPSDGTMRFVALRNPRKDELQELFKLLGEWCYFAA